MTCEQSANLSVILSRTSRMPPWSPEAKSPGILHCTSSCEATQGKLCDMLPVTLAWFQYSPMQLSHVREGQRSPSLGLPALRMTRCRMHDDPDPACSAYVCSLLHQGVKGA